MALIRFASEPIARGLLIAALARSLRLALTPRRAHAPSSCRDMTRVSRVGAGLDAGASAFRAYRRSPLREYRLRSGQ